MAAGRAQYGPVFIGHPLEELDEELLDAMNYAEEAARKGFPLAGIQNTSGGSVGKYASSIAQWEGILDETKRKE